jgi:hypothetical protein
MWKSGGPIAVRVEEAGERREQEKSSAKSQWNQWDGLWKKRSAVSRKPELNAEAQKPPSLGGENRKPQRTRRLGVEALRAVKTKAAGRKACRRDSESKAAAEGGCGYALRWVGYFSPPTSWKKRMIDSIPR